MPPVIKVIGVDGGGINAVNHLYKQDITGVDFFIFDTDARALKLSPAPNKVQLGTNLTKGINAWSVPKDYQTASIENIEDIKMMLEFDTKRLFIITGREAAMV
jgi:cell division protein FtsZ